MRGLMMRAAMLPTMTALILAGCAKKEAALPDEPVEKAASCGVIAAATEREAAGVKGDLPAEAQARIFHYPLLAASEGESFDKDRADAVFKRMPGLFDHVIKGKWQTLRPACTAAFPATKITDPVLPEKPLDRMLQCYVLVDFMRKALGDLGGSYGEASMRYGVLSTKLDAKVSPALAKAGLKNGDPLQAKRSEALSAASKLGQPSAVIAACEKAYG